MADVARVGPQPSPNVRAIYTAVSAGLVLILLFIWGLQWFISPSTLAMPITWVILLTLLPNLAIALRRGPVPTFLLASSVAANIGGTTAGVHYGGGPDQVSAPLLYTIVIGLAGLLMSGRAAFLAAVGSACAYGVVVWAEYDGLLPHLVSYTRPPDRQAATVMMVSVYLFLFAWLVSYGARQVRIGYQRAEELRREAVSALSHDLKNPLAIIAGYAQMVGDATPAERADYLLRIQHSAQQAVNLVSNVLDASAFEGRPMVANTEPVRLNELVTQVCEQYGVPAEARDLHITTTLAAEQPVIDADPQLLSRAVSNLVSNAIKYTAPRGMVHVTSAVHDGAVTVSVTDNGTGIAPEMLDRLFQPYSRVGSDEGVEGTGLGLYIVRRIAEAHGGAVTVRSTVGGGSTFTLRLPVS